MIYWVKEHSDNYENGLADSLANSARHHGEITPMKIAQRHIKILLTKSIHQ